MNYQTIRLDKSMYKTDGGFAAQLEQLDPTEHYKGTDLEGLDAFQRQLKRFDIKVSGPHSDRISKFFSTSDSAALFPEYVSRSVAQGISAQHLLDGLTASNSVINSLDYRAIRTEISSSTNPVIAEGGAIPETTIHLADTIIRLKKRGQLLKASYEAIKHQRADVITVALSQIGLSLARTQQRDAVKMLLSGDGSTIPAAQLKSLSETKFTYEHLLDLWTSFQDFEMNTLLASPATVRQLMALPEFRESTGGDSFISTGRLMTPFGAKIVTTAAMDDEIILGFDRRFALEMVTTGGIQVEYDKLIDTQLERAAITTTYGFSKLFPDAVKGLERAM